MGAEKLGAYILDHDEKSFIVSKGQLQEIEYSSGRAMVAGEEKSELLERDYKNYIDFKLSFDELNFENEDQAVEKLEALAADISRIEIRKNNKSVTSKKQMRIDENFKDLKRNEQRNKIENFIEEQYQDSRVIGTPELKAWEISQDGWGNDVVKMKIKKNYVRTQSMNNSIISIHTKSRDELKQKENYKVKPHLHLTIDRNNNWGRKYAYLKQELSQVLKKHNLTSSHNLDIKRDRSSREYQEYRILKDRISSFSWVVNKHEEAEYIVKQLKQYEKNDRSVKLNNVEEKLNRYLKLGGSYDFARKLQTNLKEKLNFEIYLKEPESYQKAARNIEKGNYIEIINEVRNQALNGEKISERYKEFAKEVLNKDQAEMKELATARAIKTAVKNRGYQLDRNFKKVIDRQTINRFCDREIKTIERLEKKEKFNQVKERIKAGNYLKQDQLRKDLKAAGVKDCKKAFGDSEVAVIFQGKEKQIRDKLGKNKFLDAAEVKKEINKMELDISESWQEKIAVKIYQEQAPAAEKGQELKEVNTKLKNLEQQRAATRANLKSLHHTCKKIGFELKKFTNDKSRDEILDELNESSEKIKAGLSILVAIYRQQLATGQFKKVKKIAAKESKRKMNKWDQYFAGEEKNIRKITDAAAKNKIKVRNIQKLQEGYKVATVKPINQIENYKKIKDHINKIDKLLEKPGVKREDELREQKKTLSDKLNKREKEYNKGIDEALETYKFKAEDSEKVFEILGARKVTTQKIYKLDRKISKFQTSLDPRIDDCKIDIKRLERKRDNIDMGGLLAKITGKARKARTKRKAIEKKIAAQKVKLEKMEKTRGKLKILKEKRSNCFKNLFVGKDKLRELRKKTRESKVHKITRTKDRGRSR
jgi:hypothetical protein